MLEPAEKTSSIGATRDCWIGRTAPKPILADHGMTSSRPVGRADFRMDRFYRFVRKEMRSSSMTKESPGWQMGLDARTVAMAGSPGAVET